MKIKYFILILLLIYLSLGNSAILLAQEEVIKTGIVTDDKNEPIIGATVVIKGTTKGVITNAEGEYSISASPQDILIVSYVGMTTIEIPFENASNISLSSDALKLDDVIVVGYGTQKRKDLTGAVATVGVDDLGSRPVTNVSSALQGKTAGVQVSSSSGKPNGGFNVLIRGASSINGSNQPLYVIDGIPTTDTRSLNASDIESISVLKDASAAAIYGASGANGVVLVTTKQAKRGEALTVDLTASLGVSIVGKKLDMLGNDEYYNLMNEIGYVISSSAGGWDKYGSLNPDGTRNWYNHTEWQDEVYRPAMLQNYQLSVRGSTEKVDYTLSAGWVKQDGVVKSNTMNRFNVKSIINVDITKWLKAGINVQYSRSTEVDVSSDEQQGVTFTTLSTPKMLPIYNEDQTFTSNPFQADRENPMGRILGVDRSSVSQRVLGTAYVQINLYDGLRFKSTFSIDYGNTDSSGFIDPFKTVYGRTDKGYAEYKHKNNFYWINENIITYSKSVKNHNFSALGGFIISENKWQDAFINAKGFAGANIPSIDGASTINDAGENKSDKANVSGVFRFTYDYNGKYLLTANMRADASSSFGSKKRWGFFPSASAGWRISGEDFLKDVKIVNDLKIRVGVGLVGNDQIANYMWAGKLGTANYPTVGGSTPSPGFAQNNIRNDELRWEQTMQTNIGIDFAMLDNRIGLSLDLYEKRTNDLLVEVPIPTHTGFASALNNIGNIKNNGIEIQISTHNIKSESFNWTTDFNISFNKNKVIDIGGQSILTGDYTSPGAAGGRGDVSITKEGQPMGMLYGYISEGVDPTTGMIVYRDLNSDGEITGADRTEIGDPNPLCIFGMTNTLTYKGLGLSIFLQGSAGNKMLNATRLHAEAMEDESNQSTAVLDRWKKPGDVTDIPRSTKDDSWNSKISTRFIEDGSFLRIKTISLFYDFPEAWIRKIKMKNLRIYATAENPFTFTKYSGYDPEVNSFGNSSTTFGIDYGAYPQIRSFIFGVNITF